MLVRERFPAGMRLSAFRCSLYFCPLRRVCGVREPARKLREDRAQINQTHGHPHQQPADLLVLAPGVIPSPCEWCGASRDGRSAASVNRTNRDRRECDNDPEHAAGDAGAEQDKISRAGGERRSSSRGARICRQNSAAQHQQRNGLQRMDRTGGNRRVAQRRHVPEPHRADSGKPAQERVRGDARTPRKRASAAGRATRKRGHNEQQKDVLSHVRAEEVAVGQRVDRRKQRQQKTRPAAAANQPIRRCAKGGGVRHHRASADSKTTGFHVQPNEMVARCSSEMGKDVNDGQHENPDGINKMPIKPNRLSAGKCLL